MCSCLPSGVSRMPRNLPSQSEFGSIPDSSCRSSRWITWFRNRGFLHRRSVLFRCAPAVRVIWICMTVAKQFLYLQCRQDVSTPHKLDLHDSCQARSQGRMKSEWILMTRTMRLAPKDPRQDVWSRRSDHDQFMIIIGDLNRYEYHVKWRWNYFSYTTHVKWRGNYFSYTTITISEQ